MTPDPTDARLASAYRAERERADVARMVQGAHRAHAERYVASTRPAVEPVTWWRGVIAGAWGVLCALLLWLAWDADRIIELVAQAKGG